MAVIEKLFLRASNILKANMHAYVISKNYVMISFGFWTIFSQSKKKKFESIFYSESPQLLLSSKEDFTSSISILHSMVSDFLSTAICILVNKNKQAWDIWDFWPFDFLNIYIYRGGFFSHFLYSLA